MKCVIPLACVAVLLSGCSSLGYVRSQDPVLDGSTAKTPSAFASCVSDAWRRSNISSEVMTTGEGRSVAVPRTLGGYKVVLDITPSSAGSDFFLYERLPHITSVTYQNGVAFCK